MFFLTRRLDLQLDEEITLHYEDASDSQRSTQVLTLVLTVDWSENHIKSISRHERSTGAVSIRRCRQIDRGDGSLGARFGTMSTTMPTGSRRLSSPMNRLTWKCRMTLWVESLKSTQIGRFTIVTMTLLHR